MTLPRYQIKLYSTMNLKLTVEILDNRYLLKLKF